MTDEQFTDDPMDRFKAIVERRVTGYDTVCTHRIDGAKIMISASKTASIIHVGIPTYFEVMPNEVIDDLVDKTLKDYEWIRDDLKDNEGTREILRDYTKAWYNLDKLLDALIAEKKLIHYRDKIYLMPDSPHPAMANLLLGIIIISPKMLDESIVTRDEFEEVIREEMESIRRYAQNLQFVPTPRNVMETLVRVWKLIDEEREAQEAQIQETAEEPEVQEDDE